MVAHVKDLLPHILQETVDWKVSLLVHWESIVGKLNTRTRLEKIYNDLLVVGVYDSHWMQELYLLSPELIEALNKHLGEDHIKRLRFVLVDEYKKKARLKTKKSSHKKYKPAVLSRRESKALDDIENSGLKDALVKFLARCQASR